MSIRVQLLSFFEAVMKLNSALCPLLLPFFSTLSIVCSIWDFGKRFYRSIACSSIHITKCEKFFCVCVCIIKLLCHFLPDLAQILNKAMNSKGAASKPVPGADFTQLLILRHLFVSHTHILADSQSDCEKVVEPKRNPNRTDFFWNSTFYPARD